MATEEDFSELYSEFNTAELLDTAHDYDSLTSPAQSALRAEFAKRGLEAPLVDETEGDQPESRKLVTLRRYRDLSEAIVARGMLESAEIAVYLQNENLVRLDWQISNGIGGIQLQVEESDAAAGLELLDQPIPRSIPFEGAEEYEQPRCPVCGSLDITNQASRFEPALVSAVGLGIPFSVGEKIWVCNKCSTRWEDSDPAK